MGINPTPVEQQPTTHLMKVVVEVPCDGVLEAIAYVEEKPNAWICSKCNRTFQLGVLPHAHQ